MAEFQTHLIMRKLLIARTIGQVFKINDAY